jgi:hypothetical protein
MDFLKRLVWIFVSPNRVFDDIRERRVSWWQPWFVVSLFYMVITWMSLPIQTALAELNPELTTEQIDQQVQFTEQFGLIFVALSPVGALLFTLLVAGLSYIAVTIASRAATFKQYLTLIFFAGIVGVIGSLVSTVMVRARGLENITGPVDAQMTLSLRTLAPDNAVLRGVLGSFEFFAIWSLVLVVMGLMRIFGMSRAQSIMVAVVLWIISAIGLVLNEVFTGMS